MDLKKELKIELREHILDYWINNTIDQESGGFIGKITSGGEVDKNAPKSAILHARILWTFSAAYNYFKDERYLKVAERAFKYMEDYFWDREFGGVFWMIKQNGEPLNTKKHIYVQAFAIYGYSEYYKASNDKNALLQAIELKRYIEKFSLQPDTEGYYEAFDREWNQLDDVRLGETDIKGTYSMNTHLHILEAYTNLYSVWKNEILQKRLNQLVRVHLDKMFDYKSDHFHSFFDADWNSKTNTYSYGHDIEAIWLLIEATKNLSDKALRNEVSDVAKIVAYKVASEGLDEVYGGIFNTGSLNNVLDDDKHWWVQAEAMVGFLEAYRITGDQVFIDAINNIWSFVKQHIKDSKKGEWFFRVSKDGNPYMVEDKVGPWKCPYHNSRACLEFFKRLRVQDRAYHRNVEKWNMDIPKKSSADSTKVQ